MAVVHKKADLSAIFSAIRDLAAKRMAVARIFPAANAVGDYGIQPFSYVSGAQPGGILVESGAKPGLRQKVAPMLGLAPGLADTRAAKGDGSCAH
jgi:hypothetical protein